MRLRRDCAGIHTVKNGTSEVTEELLEEVRLLRRNLVEAISLATSFHVVRSETGAKLCVDHWD
jgi:uncharacterized protein YdhG (YjbR/CyaY superfamily)